jgi:hypothetical protein
MPLTVFFCYYIKYQQQNNHSGATNCPYKRDFILYSLPIFFFVSPRELPLYCLPPLRKVNPSGHLLWKHCLQPFLAFAEWNQALLFFYFSYRRQVFGPLYQLNN